MLYTEMTKKAMRLCYEAHLGQVDKAGVPYVFHPAHVAECVEGEAATCAALLHDVVEDTSYALDDLRAAGFPEEVLDAVALLTHGDGVPYGDYVRAVAANPVARAVKEADLLHNLDASRLAPGKPDAARQRKYRRALEILHSDAGE